MAFSSLLSCIFTGVFDLLFHLGLSFSFIFFVSAHLLHCKGRSLRYSPGWGNPQCCIVALHVGEGFEREQCCLLSSWLAFSHFPSYPQANWALLVLIPRWVGLCTTWTLWFSPMNSPMRLGVSPATSTPTGFFSQRFWGFISPHWNSGLHDLSRSTVPPSLSEHKCGTACPSPPAATFLRVLCPGCTSLPLLLVWMNVSSLTLWLSDIHTFQFSVSSGFIFVFKFVSVLLLVVWGGKVY